MSSRSNILCRHVHTGPRQGQGPIVSYCASPIPCTAPVPVPCGMNKPLHCEISSFSIHFTHLALFSKPIKSKQCKVCINTTI